jgi:RNA polymerase sigma factor (sigma-70 family)
MMPASAANQPQPERTTSASQFRTTHWSVILEAAQPESSAGVEAFARLYHDYWYPLYAYVRRRGHGPHEAEDLTQGFFVTLLTQERLRGIERGGGRFRSFLLKSLQNFLANEWDRSTAMKRGGGLPVLPLHELDPESRFLTDVSTATPENGFDRDWALAVLHRAMDLLEQELRASGKERLLSTLRPQLQGDRGGRPYAEIGMELGLSEGAVKVAVHRLRQRYGELLRAEVARTVGDEAEIADELRHLREIVSS